ncbi:MAG: HlyD family efflux transporter periplasmic adaptor subunit [Oceanicaulis sp.]|uniref:efflux RND transporter periplasmic adaptor subunit n=1 Tax=Glycocaulis sp. TaxID=1969725 RepID=UPI0025C661CB|nr:HlyD family efflux transporter periplasmic adaptor subunit [Glycocaulis sp.]MCC5980459.1 HlyD family efflux transporter periplasmic adaptor subunit [Oceanicaulis sp.]MCH8521910.1 HlyD family efflux transporter periplasmic adaptor subunit [Glycocaulis sp.]
MTLPKADFRTVFWAVAGLAILALLVAAFWPRAELVDMVEAQSGDLTVTVRDEGRTRVREVYQVSAPLAGRLMRIGNRAGETVSAGDVVATILPGDPVLLDERTRREAEAAVSAAEAAIVFARADLQRAAAQQANARAEAERARSLYERQVIAQAGLDRAELALRTANAAVVTARASVSMREAELAAARIRLIEPDEADGPLPAVQVRAPASGRILRVMEQSEGVIAAGTPVMEIGDPRDLEIVAEFLSSDAVRIQPGAEAEIRAWGGAALRGRVRLVEPFGFLKISALGVEEQRVNVIVDLLDPPESWATLGHGYRVEAAATVQRMEDAILIPVGALFRRQGQWAVFRVDNGRARLRMVEVGANDGHYAAITAGLEAGERVVVHPGQNIADGTGVRQRRIDE